MLRLSVRAAMSVGDRRDKGRGGDRQRGNHRRRVAE